MVGYDGLKYSTKNRAACVCMRIHPEGKSRGRVRWVFESLFATRSLP